MNDDTNQRLRERIATAKARSAELADDATSRAREFVHDHPVAAVAGGIAVGALVAAAFSRRAARRKGAAALPRKLITTVVPGPLGKIAAAGADLAVHLATRVAEDSRAGIAAATKTAEAAGRKTGEKVSETAELVSDKTRSATDQLAELAHSKLVEQARVILREAGDAAVRRAEEVASRLKR